MANYNLSHMRCDLRELPAGKAARQFYCFLCDVAEAIEAAPPRIYPPHTRQEAGQEWWVVWEDCPWPQWSITGGSDISGPNQGFCSMRNGAHHPAEETECGPFFTDAGSGWYMDTYYGFDVIFTDNSVGAAP
jgi:hypothetical protein